MNGSDTLGPLARNDSSPIFEEGWQAQVLAMAFHLVEQGLFTSVEWSEALGAELSHASERSAPDDTKTYYESVLKALEGLLHENNSVSGELLNDRTQAWREAYLRTPHGQPVELIA